MAAVLHQQVAALEDCEKNAIFYPPGHRINNDSAARVIALGLTAHHVAIARARAQQYDNALQFYKTFPLVKPIPGSHIHQDSRDAAIINDIHDFRRAHNTGRLLIKKATMTNYLNRNDAGIKVFPSYTLNPANLNTVLTHSARADFARNSSCVFDTTFITCTDFGGSNIGDSAQCMNFGGGAWHANEQTTNYNYGVAVPSLTMEPIGIQTAIHSNPPGAGAQLHPFVDVTTRHTNANYNNDMVQLWAPHQNLQSPPPAALRTLPAYIHSNANMEPSQLATTYLPRIHNDRWQQLANHAWRCIIPNLNQYIDIRQGLHVIKPGLFLSNNHLISQCHYYNKVMGVLPDVHQPPHRQSHAFVADREYETIRSNNIVDDTVDPIVEDYNVRRNQLLDAVGFYSNFLASGNDIPDRDLAEVGKFAYASADLLQSQAGHMMKRHRRKFNMQGYGYSDGFQEGMRLYQFHNRELREARCEAISSGRSWGLEHIIKSRFPMIPFAARTVINGPARTPITDMIIIKDFDCFRPMEEAEVWWFEIVKESIDWRRLGPAAPQSSVKSTTSSDDLVKSINSPTRRISPLPALSTRRRR